MGQIILQSVWLILPAGIANMAPVIFKWLPFLNVPIDFNKTWRGKPILGSNKTYRGLFVGVLGAVIFVYFETLLYPYLFQYAPFDYLKINIFLLGFLLGFGALFGDALESFFKRRFNIAPGKTWAPFDQIDWILGTLIISSFYIHVSWQIWIVSLVLFGLLHPFINLIGYFLKIKKNKF